MKHNPRLEIYLTKMESALKAFPVSDRAEIITEIKSHVVTALERDPRSDLGSVLSALGEPETVANKYLIERGLKPVKPPVSSIVRWLVIGFLGTVSLVLLFVGFVIFKFFPLITLNDSKDSNSFFNWHITTDEGSGNIVFGKKFAAGSFNGNGKVLAHQKLVVNFENGEFEISSVKGSTFSWKCEGVGTERPSFDSDAAQASLDLSMLNEAHCKLQVPQDIHFQMKGENGSLQLLEPTYHFSLELENGNVHISPKAAMEYNYNLEIQNGHMDVFTSSEKKEAYQIQIHLGQGNVTREGSDN